MNDFWDVLGKAVNEAANKAIKVSGDAVELTKASLNIKFDEIRREGLFKEIGRIVYTNYKSDPSGICAEITDFCKCIDEIELDIDEQVNKSARIRNKKFCVNCCLQIEKAMQYCYSCGEKQPVIVEEPPKSEDCCNPGCGCEPVCECEPECECGTEP